MTDFSQVIRWNAGFVRGLAQSVLERARVIRGSLVSAPPVAAAAKPSAKTKKKTIKTARKGAKKPARTTSKRRTKKLDA
ncbi:MAG TPA: hypothetical protein PKC28_14155 [Bdellovibrionales bacterium]|nr:hypothetical protein [Bdellovibrionales bacterium]